VAAAPPAPQRIIEMSRMLKRFHPRSGNRSRLPPPQMQPRSAPTSGSPTPHSKTADCPG
jgi:hypothetical protein